MLKDNEQLDATRSDNDGTPSKSHPPGAGTPQPCWRPSGYHVGLGLVFALVLLVIPGDQLASVWPRGNGLARLHGASDE